MRTARTVAAAVGAVTIGALLWAAPAQATTPDPDPAQGVDGKVAVTVTAGVCGTRNARTATLRIVVPRWAVGSGPYTAIATVGRREVGRVQSLGATPRFKRITFAEDSHNGEAKVMVRVVGGRPALRPAPTVTKVDTDCRPPARPRATSTGPTCDNPNMVVTVTNPNVLIADRVMVRIGMTRPKMLRAGQSMSLTVRSGVWVWSGSPLRRLKYVPYVRATGCATATPTVTPTATATATESPAEEVTPTASATATSTATAAATASATSAAVPETAQDTQPISFSGSSNGDSGNSGGLPVTGVGVAGIVGGGLLLAGLGMAGLLFARRRRTSFTA